MLCFSDGPDGKKNCCCGCTLGCGVITFAVLAGLEALSNAAISNWGGAAINGFICLIGVLAVLSKESATAAIINWWTWVVSCVLYVIAIIVVSIFGAALVDASCEAAGLTDDECADLGGATWAIVLGMLLIGGPFLYLATGIAYYYVAEKKAQVDSGFQKA